MSISNTFISACSTFNTPEDAVDYLLSLFEGSSELIDWIDFRRILWEAYGKEISNYKEAFYQKTKKVPGGYARKSSTSPAPSATPSSVKAPAPSATPSSVKAPPSAPARNEREGWYGEDIGLRRLGISQTKCFASWSGEDAACAGCPLVRFCFEATASKMEEMAREMDDFAKTQAQKKAAAPSTASTAPAPSTASTAPAAPATSTAPTLSTAPAPSATSTAPATSTATSTAPATSTASTASTAPATSTAPAAPATSTAPAAPATSTASESSEIILSDLLAKGFQAAVRDMPFSAVCSGCGSRATSGAKVIHISGRGIFHLECAANL